MCERMHESVCMRVRERVDGNHDKFVDQGTGSKGCDLCE